MDQRITRKRHRNKKYNTKRQIRFNNKTLRKPFIKLNCSPKNKKTDYTCYSDDDLYKLRDMWNARHPDRPIKTKNTKKIWEQLKEYYATTCNKESCWVRQMTKNTKLEKELLDAFAPESPEDWKKNPNEWLSSLDILKVMNQYEKKYKCFDFLGPSPIDYDTHKLYGECVWEELCHFNLAEHIKKGHNKIGVIFNLDPHYKGGSHWVSLFIDIENKFIFFFDSADNPIPPEIWQKYANRDPLPLVNRIMKQGMDLDRPIHFRLYNNRGHARQRSNTECGMYSLFFIITMLTGETPFSKKQLSIKGRRHLFLKKRVPDEWMLKFRKIYFND